MVDDLRIMWAKGPKGVVDKWEKNGALRNYFQDAAQVGAYALLADTLQAGVYGSVASLAGGPSVGTFAESVEGSVALGKDQNVAPLSRTVMRATPFFNETIFLWMREDIDKMLKGTTSKLRETVGTAKRPRPYKVKRQ